MKLIGDKHKDCTENYDENICEKCENQLYEMVGHPGGGSNKSVKEYYCVLGYWKDDF